MNNTPEGYVTISMEDWLNIPTSPYTMTREDFRNILMPSDAYMSAEMKAYMLAANGWTEEEYSQKTEEGLDRLYDLYLEGMKTE